MNNQISLTLQESHRQKLQENLCCDDGKERAAYVLCGKASIQSDPWNQAPRTKYLSVDVILIPDNEIISHSPQHITWSTDSVVRVLKRAQEEGLTVAVVHNHRENCTRFSEQDDLNESDLMQLAHNRNGQTAKLLSLILTPDGDIVGRCWVNPEEYQPIDLIMSVGDRIQLHYPERQQGFASPIFQRQALAFGEALTQDLSKLRVGIVGCGGTGSAVAMLLPRLGVRQIALFDQDVVEMTNLNRLHGATFDDAKEGIPKVEAVGRSLQGLGIGIEVRTYQAWVDNPICQDPLKSCDIIFGCTDDNAGRVLLNRFSYYYLTPVFDMGLAIEVSDSENFTIQALDGRVTTLIPPNTCLLCREVINQELAFGESLKREQPEEYQQRKEEAYVIGEGNPSPAVVLFTTNVANMAIQELIHRLQGYRGEDGSIANRVKKYHLVADRQFKANPEAHCPVCATQESWGRGDVEPFLDMV